MAVKTLREQLAERGQKIVQLEGEGDRLRRANEHLWNQVRSLEKQLAETQAEVEALRKMCDEAMVRAEREGRRVRTLYDVLRGATLA